MTFAGRNLKVVDERLLSTNWGGLQTNKEFNSAINAQYLPRGKWTADFNSICIFTTAQCTFSQPHNAHFHNRTMHIFTTAQFVFSQPRNSHFHNRTMRIFTTAQCTFSQPVSDSLPKQQWWCICLPWFPYVIVGQRGHDRSKPKSLVCKL